MLCQSFFRQLFVAFRFFTDKQVKRRDASRMSQLAARRIFRRYVIVIMNQLRAIERILADFRQTLGQFYGGYARAAERILAYFLQGRRERYVYKVAAVREYGGRNFGNVLGDYYAVRRGNVSEKER